jgi:hypothetical protein
MRVGDRRTDLTAECWARVTWHRGGQWPVRIEVLPVSAEGTDMTQAELDDLVAGWAKAVELNNAMKVKPASMAPLRQTLVRIRIEDLGDYCRG